METIQHATKKPMEQWRNQWKPESTSKTMKTKTLKEFEKEQIKFKVSRRQGIIKIREEINRDKNQTEIKGTKSLSLKR